MQKESLIENVYTAHLSITTCKQNSLNLKTKNKKIKNKK